MSRLYYGKPGISLIGFMFTGKSSVGRMLAAKLGLKYVDLDEEIVHFANKSIEQIFAEQGEEGFRKLEHNVVARVLPVPEQVISTGGGVVIDPANREIIKSYSCVVWLKASAETILKRFHNSRGKPRPLLQVDNPKAEIKRLLATREAFYRECDFSVDTDDLKVPVISRMIMDRLLKI